MIGQTHFIGGEYYLQTNDEGTLEKLVPIKSYRQLQLYILTRVRRWTIDEVRCFAIKHHKRVSW